MKSAVLAFCLLGHAYLSIRVAFGRFDWPDLPGNYAGHAALMCLFAATHAWQTLGVRAAALFFVTSMIVSWTFEQTGVATGMIFGPYHYTDALGPKLGHVPAAIPIAWTMMLYVSWCVAHAIVPPTQQNKPLATLLTASTAALIITGWDAAIDPYFSVVGPELRWLWHDGGDYFGVPFENFRGWFITAFTAYVVFAIASRAAVPARPALPVIAFAFFTFATLCSTEPLALRITTLTSMGLAATLAGARLLQDAHTASSAASSASERSGRDSAASRPSMLDNMS